MENKSHKYISMTYKMYVMEDGEKTLKDSAVEAHPYTFVSGLGYTIDALEQAVVDLKEGETFEVTIPKEKAFGDYMDDQVVELDRKQFEFEGKLAVSLGEVVPLRDAQGNIFNATVDEIQDNVVVLDMNHPFAGYDLMFEGKIIASHEATEKELNDYLNAMTGGGCGCGCGDCGDGHCGSGGCDSHEGHDGCGCGHCH